MGIFKSLFGTKESGQGQEENTIAWIPLTSSGQLKTLEELSAIRPQLIFKHSTSCGISSMVMRQFRHSYSLAADQADLYYLDIHNFRAVSNEIADKFSLRHQSPQLIVIKNGRVIAHDSHGAIPDLPLEKFI